MASIRQSTRLRASSPSLAGTATAGSTLPTWVTNAAVNQWVAVPNSTIQGSAAQVGNATGSVIASWIVSENGSCLQRVGSRIWFFGGGHNDYVGNEIVSIGLNTNSPVWRLDRTRSLQSDLHVTDGITSAYQKDGRPTTRHTYSSPNFLQSQNKYFVYGGGLWQSGGGTTDGTLLTPATFDVNTGDWDPYGTWPAPAAANAIGFGLAFDYDTETVYCVQGQGKEFWKLNTATRVWTRVNANTGKFAAYTEAPAWSPRGVLHLTNRGQGAFGNSNSFMCALYNTTTGVITDITFNASSALTNFYQIDTNHAGVHYDSSLDCFYFYAGGLTTMIASSPEKTGTGNGALNSLTVTNAPIGEHYTVLLTSSTTFTVTGDVTGLDGSGTVGTPYIGKVSFTLAQGTTTWVAGAAYKFHVGTGGGAGRIWKIIPNNTTVWDMVELNMTGTFPTATMAVAHGNVNTRFRYVPELKGVCLLQNYNQPVYFARME